MGIETEYGLNCASTVGGAPPLDPEEAAQVLFAPVIAEGRSTNTYLENGARLYLDVGSHPEYATAECDSLTDLLANDRAGELVFASLARKANATLAKEGTPGRIHLFKNNMDSAGNSFGCHENYLVRRRSDFRARISSMLPFFVTRLIVTGAGHIFTDEDGRSSFEFSQRAHQMWDAISSASTRSRPMINTRDEPHGDAELYRRMHVIVGDSSIAQATTALKVASTEALLIMIEDGGIVPDLSLADPVAAIRAASMDLTGRARLELAAGGTITPIVVQERMRDAVMAHFERRGYLGELDDLRLSMLDLWGRAIEAVKTGDYAAIATEIDWAAKLTVIRRYQERSGAALGDPRVARLDLAYSDITSGGLRPAMEAGGLLRVIVPEEVCEQAVHTPPQGTRAKLRGDFVKAAREARADYMVDWMTLRVMDSRGSHTLLLKDPFAATDERVDALVAVAHE